MRRENKVLLFALTLLLGLSLQSKTVFAKEIKVLAIGNSFSVDAVEQYLYELGEAAGERLVIGNLAIGGASLERHYNNVINNAEAYSYKKIIDGETIVSEAKVTLIEGVNDEEWDIICLQQVSHNSGIYDTYHPYLSFLLGYLRGVTGEREVKYAFHMTWAYAENATHSGFAKYDKDQAKMYNSIVETAQKMIAEHKIDIIIPSGSAIQNGRTSSLGDTFCRDGFHLETKFGRYTAACTWYEAITGESVVGNSYRPETISEDEAFIAQLSAHLANAAPFRITDISKCGR